MRSRVILLVALAQSLLPLFSQADNRCPRHLVERFLELASAPLSSSQQAQIDLVMADLSLEPPVQAARVFEIVFENQLSGLTPEVQSSVRDLVAHRVTRVEKAGSSTHHATKKVEITSIRILGIPIRISKKILEPVGRIRLHLDPRLSGTAARAFLEFHYLVHEVEHAIQHRIGPLVDRRLWNLRTWARQRYHQEAGAMAAEWKFISALPVAKRNALVEEVLNSSLSKREKQELARWLSSEALSIEEYVAREQKAGRYSWPNVYAIAFPTRTFVGVASVVFLGDMYLIVSNRCEAMLQATTPQTAATLDSSVFYREICSRLPGMGELERKILGPK